jgi:trk system potassium uptake protein TrkA
MKVVICGAGNVGLSIVEYLVNEYDITLIDTSAKILSHAIEKFDVQTIQGDATDPRVLKRADVHKADIFVSVTASDSANIVACQLADGLFAVETKIARLRNVPYLNTPIARNYQEHYLPIDIIINPEQETVQEILRHLHAPFAFANFPLFKGQLHILGIKLDASSPFLNYPLKHLDKDLGPINTRIIKVTRRKTTFIPQHHDTFEEGDEVYFLLPTDMIESFVEIAGYQNDSTQRVLILGNNRMGFILASEIERLYPTISCIFIKYQDTQTSEFANQLNNTIVLQGDPLDHYILEEAGVQFTDNIIAITTDDNVNILSSLLGKRYGAKRATTLVSRKSYLSLMYSLGIEKPLNLSFLTLSLILRRIRKNYVHALYRLGDGTLETIMEVRIQENTGASHMAVNQINRAREIWIFAVLREDNIIFPNDDFALAAGDTLILLTDQNHFRKIQSFFESQAS